MKTFAFLLVLFLQAPQDAPLVSLRATLRQLAGQLDEHKTTYGATPDLTAAKHQLRDWIESRLVGLGENPDTRAFASTLHVAIAGADLVCDDCDWNALGYVDDVRVSREGGFLVVVTATGISCGYDESAYVYAWQGQSWRRVWEHEQNTYTQQDYLPQTIHDIQISSADASRGRLLMVLGSQTICGGAYKNVYTRAWRMDAGYQSERVLNWSERANDEYPPILGRVGTDDVMFQFTAGGVLSGDVHPALRHFTITDGTARQIDPVAGRPRDFVVEWLSSPWADSRSRSESASLEALHGQLSRSDGVGDFTDPTLRCTTGSDLWQVGTHLYERPKRYFRVRWQAPYTFTIVGISERPYPDCTVDDERGEAYPKLFDSAPR